MVDMGPRPGSFQPLHRGHHLSTTYREKSSRRVAMVDMGPEAPCMFWFLFLSPPRAVSSGGWARTLPRISTYSICLPKIFTVFGPFWALMRFFLNFFFWEEDLEEMSGAEEKAFLAIILMCARA